jgi:SAM-dependent methyltransferase
MTLLRNARSFGFSIRQPTRRPFFSFLTGPTITPEEEAGKAAQRRKEQALQLESARYRMSLQHAHALGPWRAISVAVQGHYDAFCATKKGSSASSTTLPVPLFRVLELACGPRGEPATTIARMLPLAAVHCTDSCPQAVAMVPVVLAGMVEAKGDYGEKGRPPPNLTKSVVDMSDLSAYPSDTFDVITCCYGYGLAPDVSYALSEAHRVLAPGGVLVVATWERSAMLSIGREVLETVRGGGRDPLAMEDDEAFLPPRMPTPASLELSGPGEFEALLVGAGFDQPGAVVATWGTYPFNLGSNSDDMLTMGTILIRKELESLGAFDSAVPGSSGAGGWANPVEEAFWISIRKYTDVVGGTMFLRDNTFKLTVSTKSIETQL